jgi:hypothetical protein
MSLPTISPMRALTALIEFTIPGAGARDFTMQPIDIAGSNPPADSIFWMTYLHVSGEMAAGTVPTSFGFELSDGNVGVERVTGFCIAAPPSGTTVPGGELVKMVFDPPIPFTGAGNIQGTINAKAAMEARLSGGGYWTTNPPQLSNAPTGIS